MLKINMTDFTLDSFLEWMKHERLQSYVMQGGFQLDFLVNGEIVQGDDSDSLFNEVLKSFNNAFYRLVKGDEGVEIDTELGTGIKRIVKIVKENNTNLKFIFKPYGLNKNVSVYKVNFIQATEEIVNVVRKYKGICKEAAQILSPNNVQEFIDTLFVKPTWNRDSWFSLEQIWTEYKQKYNITEEDVKKAIRMEQKKEI